MDQTDGQLAGHYHLRSGFNRESRSLGWVSHGRTGVCDRAAGRVRETFEHVSYCGAA